MRILLRKGYQRKLILLAKVEFTWDKLAKRVNISEGYLRKELLEEKRTLSEECYRRLCSVAKVNFDRFIKKRLNNNWGRSKGGKNSGSFRKPKVLIAKPSKQFAELIGIMLGDGNIWCKEGGYYYVRIVGDGIKDRTYLLKYVKPLFERLFKKKMHIIERTRDNGLCISIGNKDAVYTLEKYGLKRGDKMKNNLGIPPWMFKSKEYLKACIRGLIDTDGSICPITGRSYPYIWFSSDIKKLRETFDKAMKKLNIRTSKWNMRPSRTPDVYIGSKDMIKKYIETISFKNERHLSKIRKYAPVI